MEIISGKIKVVILLVALVSLAWAHEPEAEIDEIELIPGGKSHCPHLYKQGRAVCNLFPESVEGPFYLPNQANRRDVREGKPGFPVTISVTLAEVSSCKPIPNINVDIWSADAAGEYSAFIGQKSAGNDSYPLDDNTFLRGVQRSNKDGKLSFVTLFPGWYPGRTMHYHMAIHLNDKRHTVQLYLAENLSAQVARQNPYAQNKRTRTRNDRDSFYDRAAELKLQGNSRMYRTEVLMAFRLRKKK